MIRSIWWHASLGRRKRRVDFGGKRIETVVMNREEKISLRRDAATTVVVLMGVSGSGKTTIGKALADTKGGKFFDGDDFHSLENVAKMRAGIPLTDADRWGWLERLKELIAQQDSEWVFLACSALKESYREVLKSGGKDLCFVFLNGSKALIRQRIHKRCGHFMPEALLNSQFEALEIPSEALVVDVSESSELLVRRILDGLKMNGCGG